MAFTFLGWDGIVWQTGLWSGDEQALWCVHLSLFWGQRLPKERRQRWDSCE